MLGILFGLIVVNLTPHPVRLLSKDRAVLQEWASSGALRIEYAYSEGVVREASITGITGIDAALGADVVIVPRAVAMVPLPGVTGRILYPDGEVRDPSDPSRVIGCRYLTELVSD
jgi:hypothetical protein